MDNQNLPQQQQQPAAPAQKTIAQQLEAPATVAKFVNLFKAVHRVNDDVAIQKYEVEKFSFMKEINEKNLADCSPISMAGVFLDVISNGLSFGTMIKHVYMIKRNVKNDATGNWEPRLNYSTSPDGKIYLAQRAGSIESVSKPVIVYEGDQFEIYSDANGEVINWRKKIPQASQKIIGGFVYIVYKNGRREPFYMMPEDIERLKGYSLKNSRGKDPKANALYSSGPDGQIDTGFFRAKLISHALTNVRKFGTVSQFEVSGDAGDEIAAQYGAGIEINTNIQPDSPAASHGQETNDPLALPSKAPSALDRVRQQTIANAKPEPVSNPNEPF